ncbi:MAG: helix-turn-helix domain-containing protein [Anaerolineales bacterium]|nr:helix-turn-helix domain-containing protein [Anaerolineales bacterium]
MEGPIGSAQGLTVSLPPVDIQAAILELAGHYYAATGIKCAAITPDGQWMGAPSATGDPRPPAHRCRLCSVLSTLPACTRVDCPSVHRYGTYQAERFGGVYIYFCPKNMTHWAAPIRIEGITVASLIGGPVLMIDPEEFLQDDILEGNPVPPEQLAELREICSEIPYVDPARVRSLSEILKSNAQALSTLLGRKMGAPRNAAVLEKTAAFDAAPHSGGIAIPASPHDGYPMAKERELLHYISKGDLDGSRKTLNEILGLIFFYSNNNLEAIKLRVEELVVLLSRAAIDGGASTEEIIGLNNDYLVRVRDSQSVYDLSAFLSIILSRFVDCVFTLRSIKHADLIRKSIYFIHSQYTGILSLEKVAEFVHLSPSHFSRIFHEATGESFVAYLTRIRIEKAKTLLQTRSIPLAEIGARTGFKDQSYFTRVFKRNTGMSPGKYRVTRGLNARRTRIDESNIEIHET